MMTLRRIAFATTLIPFLGATALAQTDAPKADRFTMDAIVGPVADPPQRPKNCDELTTLQIEAGVVATGPIDVGERGAISPSIHFDKDAVLVGPLKIEKCDGKWRISGDLSK